MIKGSKPGKSASRPTLRVPPCRGSAAVADAPSSPTVSEIYGDVTISERHRHRYEVNIDYRDRIEQTGLAFSGLSPDGVLPEICERSDHPWFIGGRVYSRHGADAAVAGV